MAFNRWENISLKGLHELITLHSRQSVAYTSHLSPRSILGAKSCPSTLPLIFCLPPPLSLHLALPFHLPSHLFLL